MTVIRVVRGIPAPSSIGGSAKCHHALHVRGYGESAGNRHHWQSHARSGRLVLRCDFAQQSAGWTGTANYWAQLPAGELGALGAALAEWPEIRLCVATADDTNALLIAWLRGQHECILLENHLLQSFPKLHITERQITLRALKRMGRRLSPRGPAIDYVPFAVWPSPVAIRAT